MKEKILKLIKDNYFDEEEYNSLIELFSFIDESKINNGFYNSINILVKFKLDIASIFAFTIYTFNLNVKISDDISFIIKKLNEIEKISETIAANDAECIRKMFIAMSEDLRVLIIKLCLILNEISVYTLPINAKEKMLLNDVKEIYAPLAERLGLNALKSELEDHCLKLLQPKVYEYLLHNVMLQKTENDLQISITSNNLNEMLLESKISGIIMARQKHFSSIYKKMKSKNLPLNMIYDIIAVRVIVESVEDCYTILGKIHSIYKPIPGRFKDYIASPKTNGYQSLHTTIIADNERPLEIQIRTFDMHRYSEYGIAAHWLYKEKKSRQTELDKKLSWIREIMESSANLSNEEFIDTLKTNLYGGVIFVQTPKGKIVELPDDSNLIDFAYAIHSEIGNTCVGGKINSKIKPLITKLNNGDIVEIITSPNSKGPSRDWLKYVKTANAKSKIHAFFKKELKEENIKIGKSIVEQGLKAKGLTPAKVLTDEFLSPIIRRHVFRSIDELFASIGYGSFNGTQVINRLYNDYQKQISKEKLATISNTLVVKTDKDGVLVDGSSGMLIRYANCCTPLSSDDIIGYISRGRGVTIHKCDCENVKYLEKERLIKAEWSDDKSCRKATLDLKILTNSKENIIPSLTQTLVNNKYSIVHLETKQNGNNKTYIIGVEITSNEDRIKIIQLINQIKQVDDVKEMNGRQNGNNN